MKVLNVWGNKIQNLTIFDQIYRTNRSLSELNFANNLLPDGHEIPRPSQNIRICLSKYLNMINKIENIIDSLMRVISLLADNFASGLTYLSFDAASTFGFAIGEYAPSTDEIYHYYTTFP